MRGTRANSRLEGTGQRRGGGGGTRSPVQVMLTGEDGCGSQRSLCFFLREF